MNQYIWNIIHFYLQHVISVIIDNEFHFRFLIFIIMKYKFPEKIRHLNNKFIINNNRRQEKFQKNWCMLQLWKLRRWPYFSHSNQWMAIYTLFNIYYLFLYICYLKRDLVIILFLYTIRYIYNSLEIIFIFCLS